MFNKQYQDVELGDIIYWPDALDGNAMVVGKTVDPHEAFARDPDMTKHAYFLRIEYMPRSDADPSQIGPIRDTLGYPSTTSRIQYQDPTVIGYNIRVAVNIRVNAREWDKMTEIADPGSSVPGEEIPPVSWQKVELEGIESTIREALQRDMTPSLDACAETSHPKVVAVMTQNRGHHSQYVTLRHEAPF